MTRLPRIAGWYERWRPILPLLFAELVLWVGFGALLPVLPIYFTKHGIGLATLGLVVAAWPAARLIAEPIFGWIADRTARKPLLVAALLASAVVVPLPLIFVGPAEFIILRALTGLATAAYDPAARGFLVDATPPDRRGEAFGLYGAAQMAGLLIGPAIGGFGTSIVGNETFVFVFGAISSAAAGIIVAAVVRELPRIHGSTGFPVEGVAELVSNPGGGQGAAAEQVPGGDQSAGGGTGASGIRPPASLLNRLLIAAIAINLGSWFAQGAYEVIWSLYLASLGAGLDLIGATFTAFGLPMLLFSPIAGRFVDRRGSLGFIVIGSAATIVAGILYTLIRDPVLAIPIILCESTGIALLSPALFTVVAAGSPEGRSSTAQGIFGAAGTVGFIVSSLVAGWLATIDLRYPFWMFAIVMVVTLGIGLAIGRRSILAIRPIGTT